MTGTARSDGGSATRSGPSAVIGAARGAARCDRWRQAKYQHIARTRSRTHTHSYIHARTHASAITYTRTHAHTPEADGSCEVPPSLSHLLSLSLFQSEYTTSIIFILLYTLLYCYICYYSLPGGDAQPALCSTTASSMSAPTKAALVGYSIIYCEYNII